MESTFVPCVISTIVTNASENIFGKVTMRVYGIKGFHPQNVFFSEQQYQRLTNYLVNLMERLNATTTREKAFPLFKEAVVELNNYGLLPRELGVDNAYRLVVGNYQNSKLSPANENGCDSKWIRRYNSASKPHLKNLLCLFSATATKLPEHFPSPILAPFGILLFLGLAPAILASILGLPELANSLAELGLLIWNSNPIRVSNYVLIDGYSITIRSIGLKGLVQDTLGDGAVFVGFSGLMLSLADDTTFFLGFAVSFYDVS